ncbi:MAG TPA: ABC transporter substrate-binding protein, partial [Acidimicrobiia bacterium]
MGKINRRLTPQWVALACAVLTGCAPVAAGPELPRPAQAAPVPTTAPSTTTTTLDPAEVMARECPTELCLVYHIDPAARWSDGEPVTVADFARTAGIMSDPLAGGPEIYDSIVSLDAIDTATFRLALSGTVGDWPVLFERLLPEQAGETDLAALPGTGPFQIVEQVSGDRIVVRRVDDWWSSREPISGATSGTVNEIVFVFISDQEELLDALEDGTVDVVSTRATTELLEGLADVEGYQHVVTPGPFWEHIDFHHEDPMLSQQWVREVFTLAIDREKALESTVRAIDPTAMTLDNTVWMQGTESYEPHYVDRYDPVAAEQLLVDHGCQREGDVYVCGDREMTFRWASTTDDPARRDLFESVRDDLETVGIELVGDFRSPSGFVIRDFLFAGPDVWQLVNFSWRASPDPARADGTYLCDGSG